MPQGPYFRWEVQTSRETSPAEKEADPPSKARRPEAAVASAGNQADIVGKMTLESRSQMTAGGAKGIRTLQKFGCCKSLPLHRFQEPYVWAQVQRFRENRPGEKLLRSVVAGARTEANQQRPA